MSDPVTALAFDPAAATVIREPLGSGYGFWAGGHKVSYDPGSGRFVLFYRQRSPLEQGRGARCAVAIGTDGVDFTDVWAADKGDLAATSIEVGHCLRHDESEWRLYLSYEFAPTGRWRIDVLRGGDPASLDTQGRRTVLDPGDFGLPWIKDPWVERRDADYHLYAAAPARRRALVHGTRIEAGPMDATVLAVSADGLYFPTLRYVFEAAGDDSWHGRRARVNSMVRWEEGWVATWDGGRTFYDNYEEWCGLAATDDGKHFTRLETGGPWVRSSYGCVRYVYGLRVEDTVYWYFEYTRRDGSHDLRVAVVEV